MRLKIKDMLMYSVGTIGFEALPLLPSNLSIDRDPRP